MKRVRRKLGGVWRLWASALLLSSATAAAAPALIVWGRNDPAFIAPGAEAYLRDLPKAELHLIDAGHFAVEERPQEVAGYVLAFMRKRGA